MKKTTLMTALLLIASVPAVAQMHEGHDHSKMMADKEMQEGHDHSKMMAGAEMEMSCADMMKMHDGMKKKMEAMDARLTTLVDEMNAARGSAKTEKMAAIINELVGQRHALHEGMMTMQPMMMRHMMEYMQKGMPEGMSDCPMMKTSKEESHEQHH